MGPGESVGSNDSPGKPQVLIAALKIADVIVATAARIPKTNEG
jgi:hypothetical protein